jgi:hypothetical protein
MTNSTARVLVAFSTTRSALSAYFASCLAMRSRLSPAAAGSGYDLEPSAIETALFSASWAPYEHPAVMKGCTAFRAELPGFEGLSALADLPPETPVVLRDPKKTGFVEACVALRPAEAKVAPFTVAILGEDDGKEVVFTFHPGEPIMPSRVKAEGKDGLVITAAEALALGLSFAKIEWMALLEHVLAVEPVRRSFEDLRADRLERLTNEPHGLFGNLVGRDEPDGRSPGFLVPGAEVAQEREGLLLLHTQGRVLPQVLGRGDRNRDIRPPVGSAADPPRLLGGETPLLLLLVENGRGHRLVPHRRVHERRCKRRAVADGGGDRPHLAFGLGPGVLDAGPAERHTTDGNAFVVEGHAFGEGLIAVGAGHRPGYYTDSSGSTTK